MTEDLQLLTVVQEQECDLESITSLVPPNGFVWSEIILGLDLDDVVNRIHAGDKK
jgi:hypothetical protein